jgi:ribulose-phosphate 3-epimerase
MMDVIPSINCPDERCAAEKIEALKLFLPTGDFVHLDVTDGVFSPHKTWNDPKAWSSLRSPFALEVHLMVEFPLEHAEDWLAAGASRLIIHAETLEQGVLHGLSQLVDRYHAELVLASRPETMNEVVEPLVPHFAKFLVLAVVPGAAGQEFLPFSVEKIRFLRETSPDATIEVDGGITLETARLVKSAGADTLVSAHYIFNNNDPKKAYEDLTKI